MNSSPGLERLKIMRLNRKWKYVITVLLLLTMIIFFTGNCSIVSSSDIKQKRVQKLYDRFENQCIQNGWKKVEILVDGVSRKILWKGPNHNWNKGAIIALHGGGGTYSNFCANIKIGRPMIEFSDMVIREGFSIFSLESSEGLLRDKQGESCGKRWVSLGGNEHTNPDLVFIGKVINDVIPGLRPATSSKSIFMTGISNGGFMTVLAANYYSHKISAFAPVSAGDPYGIYVDCSQGSVFRHTPGKFIDKETNKPINEKGACYSPKTRNENTWVTFHSAKKRIPFKLFYHLGDSIDDTSCKHKLELLLEKNGYSNDGSFVLGDASSFRWPLNHFWMKEYNKPLTNFFKTYSANIQ